MYIYIYRTYIKRKFLALSPHKLPFGVANVIQVATFFGNVTLDRLYFSKWTFFAPFEIFETSKFFHGFCIRSKARRSAQTLLQKHLQFSHRLCFLRKIFNSGRCFFIAMSPHSEIHSMRNKRYVSVAAGICWFLVCFSKLVNANQWKFPIELLFFLFMVSRNIQILTCKFGGAKTENIMLSTVSEIILVTPCDVFSCF